MKRINTLMALLITGYIIGVLNYVLLPKYNIIFGLKGILIGALVSLAVLVLIRSETESTKRTRYLPYEFMFKVSRTPGLMITFVLFLVIVAGITAYLSGWAMIFLLGQDSSFIVPLAILTILIAALLLLLAKGRTVELLAVLSVLVIVLTLVSVFLIRNEASSVIVSKQAKLYMDHVLSSMWSFDSPLNIQGLATFFSGILLAFGLGAGVYYVIGSFSPEELNVERVLLGVFVLQLILGIAASYTVAYSLGASFQAFEDAVRNPNASPEEVFRLYREFQTLKSYTGNPSVSVHESIQAFYLIPSILLDVLPKAKLMVYSLLISLYMAGFTTVIVLIEMGAQMTAEVVQTNRRNALATVSVLSLAISLAMWNEALFKVFIFLPFSIVGILAAIEAYPSLKSLQSHEKLLTALGAAVMLVIGLGSLYYSLTGIFAMKLAAITGLILLVPVAFNSMLLRSGRQR
ncbi:hypothetical membrane protein, conserved [Thermococcus kodakarensis KOD1]|uniref:Hypothetical membrane protein, conserved n=1 Tax=Thermococcus kodakarensis (strain ATCC BAA-918 / JCM 12380 / KOD1) TaxID=69014 RepID=Q5JI43_THEKO|nr:sodium-dependent transporter [Thermococcus kodakarensis]WCN28872.1 sodium-dependent transporter [Thermococcus kodakarensis]WCN31175.1 sodium-dependent transporter [Thermococcus kodakarensis]BAD85066.1 hypothetical membrane protein, conserved [Thermococcus kodakarensis KOD1]